MLLVLDSTIGSLDLKNDINACAALENLLGAVFSGSHLVTGSPQLLTSLIENNGALSRRSDAVLREIKNKLPQYGALFNKIKTRIHICADITEPIHTKKYEWKLPLYAFINLSTANKTLVLTEDSVDAEIYLIAAEHFRIKNKIGGVITSGRPDGGGGSRIIRKFNKIAKDQSDLCFCITDSDRYSPNKQPKRTSRICASISEQTKWAVQHKTTKSRELENVLPHKIIAESVENADPQQFKTWTQMQNKFRLSDNVAAYADFKDGTNLQWIVKMPVEGLDHKFWMDFVSKSGVNPSNLDCLNSQKCQPDAGCNCSLIPGLGGKLAELVLEWLNRVTLQKSLEYVSEEDDLEWLEIGEQVFEWCCAGQPMRC